MIALRVTALLFFLPQCISSPTYTSDSFKQEGTKTNMARHTQSTSNYYTRYPSYPKYCSSPPEMASRSIPPLNIEGSGLSSDVSVDIIQVNTIIRHGQRTPYAGNIPCWSEYKENWDCEVTTLMSPPRMDPTENYLLFEKKYDALKSPLGNELGGTCKLGQLIEPGYDQELMNGKILRNAYFGDADQGDVYGGTNLFLHNDTAVPKPYTSPYTFYRVDDEQRTLTSGQVLLRGLFEEEVKEMDEYIELHTADYSNDVLFPNEQICPELTKLRIEALQSDEFQQKNSSSAAEEIRKVFDENLGSVGFMHRGEWVEPAEYMLDCLMTTICTDRFLPKVVNDFGSVENGRKGMFEQIVDFSVAVQTFHLRYNDAAYSKLAMGPLWSEILDRIRPLRDMANSGRSPVFFNKMFERGIPRLALYSGHDSTLQPLLATLGSNVWDGEWTPYASMLIIEIYALKGQNPIGPLAFRLLYNGEVITDRMDLCPKSSELCSIDILFETVGPSATNNHPSCDVDIETTTLFGSIIDRTTTMIRDPMEKYIVVAIALASFLVGWFLTYICLRRKIPLKRGNNSRATETVPSTAQII